MYSVATYVHLVITGLSGLVKKTDQDTLPLSGSSNIIS